MHINWRLVLKQNTLQWKIMRIFIFVVLVMGVTGLNLYYRETVFINNYNLLLENILSIQQMDDIAMNNSDILQKYKGSGSRNYIAQLNSNKERMNAGIDNLKENISNKKISYELNRLKDMAADYSKVVNLLITSDASDNTIYIIEAEELMDKISGSVKSVYNYQIDEIRLKYRQFNDSKKNTEIIAFIIILVVMSVNVILIVLFTNNLMKPVKILTAAAKEVSKGNFNTPVLMDNVPTQEFSILTSAFRQMTEKIKQDISELNEKVDIERRLKQEELKNERTRLLLKEAELLALQSQVNPHFMFNTLNIIAKIAYTEAAERTAAMIGTMSKMLRYSLGSLNKVVSLEEEILNIDEYMFIQKTRFGDRIQFIKNIECEITHIQIPCLTIQPIVENAILHGIECKEEGGYVSLSCYKNEGNITVVIKDNGIGIRPDILDNIFSKDRGLPHRGHTTGLGINNVKDRLELFYERNDVFEIYSMENEGTEVRIKLPCINEKEI